MKTLTKKIHNLACTLCARPLQQGLVQYLASVWHERKDRRQLRRQAGIALTEMLVATAILATVAVSALLGLSTSIKGTASVTNGRAAMDIAQSQMESIRKQPFATFEQWDVLDDVATHGWTRLQSDETVSEVTIQPEDAAGRGREAISCLEVVAGTDDNPGVDTGNITYDWSDYDRVLLWVWADTTEDIRLRIRTGGGDWATFDATPLVADEWERLDFDLGNPTGIFDISTIKQIEIFTLSADDGYTLRIDDFCLADGSYPSWPDNSPYQTLPDGEVHKWDPSCIDIYVTPDPDGDGNLDLQKIRVTVTYASGTKTFALEGYKSSR
jgi:type II secretory pathway pseudopilin PulG